MDSKSVQIMISMVVYMAAVIGIGLAYMKKANKSTDAYLLGGRSLGPWVTAMSAEASDMSGWLLMGLPGVAYWCGLADAAWTAIGLAVGTYLNWLITSRRLRSYSVVANDSITLPDFFSNRFRENKKIIMTVSALFIIVFFTIYASSCFVTCGKLFSTLFGLEYQTAMILGVIFVLAYTLLGGFLAESASDFMQSIVMIFALAVIMVLGVVHAGGIGAVAENAKSIPGFLEFFGIATPVTENGVQQIINGQPQFGEAGKYSLLSVASCMAWGLGYFGMPQVLLRFMAIRDGAELKRSRRIATVWVVIAMAAAIFIGLIGRTVFPDALTTSSDSENIFILMSESFLPPLLAGLVMAGILASVISSSDSYLLIAASALSKNIFAPAKKNADDKQVLWATRITLLLVAIVGAILASDENNQVIFTIVSFAWAGFGATFGPLMIFSLFWKRINRWGALAGMVSGGAMVFIWKLLLKPMGGVFGIYELLPAFLVSCIFIVVVSLLTAAPSKEIQDDFEKAKANA
ncbi:MAG: sodium/proline symporter PutP [Firmicutes bacterium]|nr:sodium/proline symporter PutP [Bacillota bacterium]